MIFEKDCQASWKLLLARFTGKCRARIPLIYDLLHFNEPLVSYTGVIQNPVAVLSGFGYRCTLLTVHTPQKKQKILKY